MIGTVPTLSIQFRGRTVTLENVSVEDIIYDVILGCDWVWSVDCIIQSDGRQMVISLAHFKPPVVVNSPAGPQMNQGSSSSAD